MIAVISKKAGVKIFMSEENNEPIYKYEKRLDSLKAARQFMGAAIIAYDQGKISSEKLSTLSTAINTLIRALEKGDIEQRMEELEELLEERQRFSA
jgi:hypothetical protein